MSFLDFIWNHKFLLAFYTVMISFGSFTVLYALGIVPNELKLVDNSAYVVSPLVGVSENAVLPVNEDETGTENGQLPKRIIIDRIGVDSFVSNPTDTDAAILNEALLKGAVRYPGSGTLGKGNLFLFGHNTRISIVNNQAYKAFNRLNTMLLGDTILVESDDMKYTYVVTSISQVDSEEKLVDFSKNKNMLTLSTCDLFGKKQERYVVEAVFKSSSAL